MFLGDLERSPTPRHGFDMLLLYITELRNHRIIKDIDIDIKGNMFLLWRTYRYGLT